MNNNNPALERFIQHYQLQLPVSDSQAIYSARQAAVLVPIVCRAEPTLLLTQRASGLRTHAGQVAFPGGLAEPGDQDLCFTALREAQEEVAIPMEKVQILGTLPALNSSRGLLVTPVVGLVPAETRFIANEDEVQTLFEIPLSEALRLTRYHSLDFQRAGITRRVYLSWYQQQFIWGLTANIIHQLALQVSIP